MTFNHSLTELLHVSGELTRENRTQRLRYRAYSNDYNDKAASAELYALGNLFDYDDYYQIGNDADLNSYPDRISVARDDDSAGTADDDYTFPWIIDYSFTQYGKRQIEQDKDGNLTDNPPDFRQRYRISWNHQSVDVHNAQFLGSQKGLGPPEPEVRNLPWDPAMVGRAPALAIGEFRTPSNSAFVAFDPPLQGTETDMVLKVLTWELELATEWTDLIGKVNNETLKFDDANVGLPTHTFEPYTLKLESLGDLQNEFINVNWVWPLVIEFHWRKAGWYEKVLDQGREAWAGEGAPDGQGGTISANDLQEGHPCKRRILTQAVADDQQRPVPGPVPLNGSGQPVGKNELCVGDWYLRWLREFTGDMTALPIIGLRTFP